MLTHNTITLRDEQWVAISDTYRLRDETKGNVLCVLPTGSGKSLTLAEIARQYAEAGLRVVIFAHRDVLISQLSEALCKTGITHNFICSKRAELAITNRNHVKFGDSFHNATSLVTVSSNPTFNARVKGNKLNPEFLNSVALVLQDEGHHATRNSSWGNCFDAMLNAIVIAFTATPLRNDGKGLGIHASSYFSAMSVTTTMFDLIKKGSLSPYKIFCPESDIDLTDVNVTSSGDYNQSKLGVAMDKRHITGDAIEEYQRIAGGHKAITFCVNINHATHVAELFNANGIPSAAVSSKMTQGDRDKIMTDFEDGRILNLVNVDLIGEGYDCPAVTVAIFLRPTQSYSLFKQQFGRVLRTAPDKQYGIVIDHVGNVEFMMRQYGLRHVHDDPVWSLDDAEKASKKKNGDDDEPMDTMRCPVCAFFALAEDFTNGCPDCGHIETPSEKEERIHHLQEKKGNLIELNFDVITEILKERERVDLPVDTFRDTLKGLPQVAYSSALNSHAKRLHAQTVLRDSIQTWCESFASESGLSPALVQREFEVTFGENILKAQTLSERKAMDLNKRICSHEMYRANQTVQ